MFGKVVPQTAQSQEQDDLLQSLLRADAPGKSSVPATPQQPPVQAPPQTASPGSFTQMFQALKPADEQPVQVGNPPPVPAAPPTPVAPPKPAADLTSVFTPVSINKPLAPAASPVPPPFPVGQKLGEFTQLLQTLKEQAAPPPPPVAETTQNPAQPGSFTQVFKAASALPVTAETEFAPVHVPEAASMPPQPVTPAAPASPPVAAPAQAPGAFTQMFQTLSPPKPTAETPAPPPVQPAPVASAAPPQPAAVGGFTQMFQALSSAKEPAPVSAQPAPAFEPSPAPKSGPGSFTQMFSQIGGQNAPQEDPLASLQQQPPPSANFQFSTPAPQSSRSPFGNTPVPAPTPSAQGGFTQLFQALGKEETAPAKEPPPLMPLAPAAAAPGPPAAGGFTQLLRTLNTGPAPQPTQAAPPPLAPVPAAPISSSGPGEFTRIISGSMLRGAQGQNVTPGPPVMPPAGQAGGGQPAFQMPQAPAFPKIHTAPPPMPSPMSQMHAGGGGSAPQMPHFQPPAFQFPQPPPAAAPQPPPPGKLQQYLPLILIVNVFVLIVVILIVVFALRHH